MTTSAPSPVNNHVIHDTETGGLSAEEFKAAFRQHPSGIAVITADAGDGPVAMTASSVFSVSVAPPVLVFSVSELSSAAPTILAADTLVVNMLSADNLDLALLGAASGVDRFADTTLWNRLDTGEPYYVNSSAWIRGRVVDRMQIGGSTVVAVHALNSSDPVDVASAQPLVYHNRAWYRLGPESRLEA